MAEAIGAARSDGDSLGGIVTCVARNVPVGLGAPVFDRLEAVLAKGMLSLPAAKGFDVGSGFDAVSMTGRQHNDAFAPGPDGPVTTTNRSGGVQGGISTGDDVVRIEVVDATSPYLAGVLDAENDPQWWLEGSSYPITVVDPERVRVLIRSKELGEKYGEQAVAVVFPYGKGEVFHMISHYYLQRTELRNDRHQQTAASYATEKGVPVDSEMAAIMSNLNLGDVESAESSTRLFANIVADKKRRIMDEQDG